MANILPLLLVIFALLSWCNTYKILAVFTHPGKSHSLLGDASVKLLLEAGHEVTYITPFPKKYTNPNLHQVDVSVVLDTFPDKLINIQKILNKQSNLQGKQDIFSVFLIFNEKLYKNENITKLLNDPNQKFDLIVTEWMFGELSSAFSEVYECPYIWFFSREPNSWVLSFIDESSNPAYKSDFMSGLVPPLTFIQRIWMLWKDIYFAASWNLFVSGNYNKLYQDVFGPIMLKNGKPLPSYDAVKYNASLMLTNSHASLGDASTLPQNCKPIAGFHINSKVNSLPEDLKEIMDSAKYGVIYFSMGSALKSKDWPSNITKGLLKMFGELKQTVLWKFEDKLLDIPANVHILPWAPQHSILSHPNCALFITHGGYLSTTETIHFGVPIIGIPVFADQFINVKRSVKLGIAIEVLLSYGVADDLKVAVKEALNNPCYRERVKELSLVYHDRVAAPSAELVYWVEHVVRTRGAPHLRSPARIVPLYQKLYLDLIILILGAIIIVQIVLKRIFYRKNYRKQNPEQLKKNQ